MTHYCLNPVRQHDEAIKWARRGLILSCKVAFALEHSRDLGARTKLFLIRCRCGFRSRPDWMLLCCNKHQDCAFNHLDLWRIIPEDFRKASASQPLAFVGTSQTKKKGKNEFLQNLRMSRWEQDSLQTRPGLSFTTGNQALASPSGSRDFCLTLGNFSVTLNLFRVKPAFVSQLVVSWHSTESPWLSLSPASWLVPL